MIDLDPRPIALHCSTHPRGVYPSDRFRSGEEVVARTEDAGALLEVAGDLSLHSCDDNGAAGELTHVMSMTVPRSARCCPDVT